MRLTRWAVFASLWLLAVGVVGTATWYAIESAGRSTQVLASADAPRGAVPGTSSSGAATPSAGPTSAAAPTSPSQEVTQEPSTSDAPSTSYSTTPGPAAGSSTRPSSARTSTTTSRPSTRSSSSSSSSSSPRAQSKFVKTPGGSVTITCRVGEQIDFTVRPGQGWRAQANQQGPQEADIKFVDGAETWEVHALCVAAAPQWTVEHKQHDD